MHVSRWLVIALFSSACAAPAATGSPTPTDLALQEGAKKTSTDPAVNPHAAAIAGFKARVDAYADLHKRLAKGDAKLKETADPAQDQRRQGGAGRENPGGARPARSTATSSRRTCGPSSGVCWRRS